MIRRTLALLTLLVGVMLAPAQGQNALSHKEMVAITPVVCDAMELDEYSKKMLNMKLTQMVTANGFSSTAYRYALVPNVVMISKSVTATAPAMYVVEFELSLFVFDTAEGVTLAETSMVLRGLNKVENKAFISALNGIKPASPQLKAFMEKAKNAILDYYTTRTLSLLKRAQSLSEMEQYDEAMAILAPIPESVAEYDQVSEALVAIYKKRLDREAVVIMQSVNRLTSEQKYDEALDELAKVATASNYWDDANKQIDAIIAKMEAAKRAALEAEKMRLDAQIAKAKELTAQKEIEQRQAEAELAEAARQAEASKSQLDKFSEKVNVWFLGMFGKR